MTSDPKPGATDASASAKDGATGQTSTTSGASTGTGADPGGSTVDGGPSSTGAGGRADSTGAGGGAGFGGTGADAGSAPLADAGSTPPNADGAVGVGSDGGTHDGGGGAPPIDAGPDAVSTWPTTDQCSSTPCRLSPPDLTHAVDLETFQVPDDPQCERLVPPVVQAQGHITVPPNLYEARLPPCRFPVRMPAPATLTPVIDGNLADWSGVSPASIDREGDLAPQYADYDLIKVYHAEDTGNYYFGFVFKTAFPTGSESGGVATLTLQFNYVTMPRSGGDGGAGSGTNPDFPLARLLYFDNGTLLDVNPGALPAGTLAAGNGRSLEIRLPKSAIPASPDDGSTLWTLLPSVCAGDCRGSTSAGTVDEGGAVWGGVSPNCDSTPTCTSNCCELISDYGCLVPTARGRVKLFTFRHAKGVLAEEAEAVNRSVIAAAPCVEASTNDTYDFVDTVNVTTVPTMAAAGLHAASVGIFVAAAESDNPLSDTGVAERFHVAAHEYAHGLNSDDYALPATWMMEGHSERFANRAAEAALGMTAAQYSRFQDAESLTDEEDPSNPILLGESWPSGTLQFSYAKTALFADLLPTEIANNTLRSLYRKTKDGNGSYRDGKAFLDELQLQLPATASPTPWNGWFQGTSYTGSLFPRAIVQADADHDGLLDYQETLLGLGTTDRDTDHDGVTDAFELAAGTDPKTADLLQGLVMDGSLDDWDKLARSAIQPLSTTRSGGTACSGIPYIVRGGVVSDGDWLAAAVELSAEPTDSTFRIGLELYDHASGNWQVIVGATAPYIYAFANSSRLRTTLTTAPASGRQIEIYYRLSWFGWNSGIPSGLTADLVTAVGSGTRCETSSALTIAAAP